MRIFGSPSAIVGEPFYKLSAEELHVFVQMVEKAMSAIRQEIERLMHVIENQKE
jgi:DNA polymerase III delta subunit